MQRSGVIRCIANLTNVGTSVVTGTFTPNPPVRGKIIFFDLSFTGAATQVTLAQIREGTGGSIRLAYTNEAAAFQDSPTSPYSVSTPSNLKAQATTDDVGATSGVSIIVDIEVE